MGNRENSALNVRKADKSAEPVTINLRRIEIG